MSKDKIEEILKSIFDSQISIKNGVYEEIQVNNSILILFAPYGLSQVGFFPSQIILEFQGDKWWIYPRILDCIENLPVVVMKDKRKLLELTFGKEIDLDVSNGIYIVKDKSGTNIALGQVSHGLLTPMTDLGAYLRLETQ